MIHVLLTSELPWQQNGAITFSCLSISRFYKVFFLFVLLCFFFFQKSLLGACTYLGCLGWWQSLNKFYKSVLEIFWNKVSRVIKTVNKHAIDIISEHLKKTIRSENAVSSHSGLIPSENCTKKERVALADCEKEEFHWLTFGCFLYHFCM